jgi:hypothetical protein
VCVSATKSLGIFNMGCPQTAVQFTAFRTNRC